MKLQPLAPELQQRLPSPQGVALAILEACRREDVTANDVARLVQTDPALTGRLLKRANASTTGSRPVVAVLDAVNRIGLQSVRKLALSFSLIDQYAKGQCAGFDYAAFWSHSLLMGLTMQELSNYVQAGPADELFTTGLLSRIGTLALATAYPQEYGELLVAGNHGRKLLALEKDRLHIDHIDLTTALLNQWGLPDMLIEPLQFHEDPTLSHFASESRLWLLSHSFHLAFRIADFGLASNSGKSQRISELAELSGRLGIVSEDLAHLVDAVVERWKSWGQELNIKYESVPKFEALAKETVPPDEDPDAGWLRVLLVEDDPVLLTMLEGWLKSAKQHTVRTARNGSEALAIALDFMPHVVLTDWRMPVMDGMELCKTLRSSDWGQNIYVLMLTSAQEEAEMVRAFDAGVDDFLTKPVNLPALSSRLKGAWRYVRLRDAWESDHQRLSSMAAELALSNRRLQQAALTDPLTDLANRRAGLNALTQASSSATRYEQPLSVISMDIDHFKTINDSHGHAVGDEVLRALGHCLRAVARKEDTVCRWGGEEFLMISPNVPLEKAILAAQRLRKTVEALRIEAAGITLPLTVSLGLASWEGKNSNQEQLLIDVDRALYVAKAGGRNRVALFRQGKVELLPN
jgi:two-component system, cell cycle response regulator